MKKRNFGSDFDIDSQRNGVTKIVNKAYIVYWDRDYNVIQESIMHSETVFPITILEAIRVLAPENAAGCNVTFELVGGNFTKLNVIEF